MKFTLSVFMLCLFSFHAQANVACKIIFDRHESISALEEAEKSMVQSLKGFQSQLSFLFGIDFQALSRSAKNELVSVQVETNNDILDTVTWLHSQKFRFDSRSKREHYQSLIQDFKTLLTAQGYKPEFIDRVFEIRFRVADEVALEEKRTRGVMGFVASTQVSLKKNNSPTFGFLRVPKEAEGYGRVQPLESKISMNQPIGFVRGEEKVQSQEAFGLGFTPQKESAGEAVFIQVLFNEKTGFFDLKTNVNSFPMGFGGVSK